MGKIWRITRYDLVNDGVRMMKYYLLLFAFVVADCTVLRINAGKNYLIDGSFVGFEGYLWKILGGCDFFNAHSRDIKLPVEYLLIGTLILLIVTGYASREFKSGGYRSLLPTGSRRTWLVAKYLQIVIKTIIFMAVIGLGIVVNLIFEGDRFWQTNVEVITSIEQYPLVDKGKTLMALVVFAGTVIALALIILALDCLLGSLYSLICGCVYLVASCYIDSFLFSGSNMMLVRNVMRQERGTGVPGLLLGIWTIAVVLTVINFITIKKKDNLKKGVA